MDLSTGALVNEMIYMVLPMSRPVYHTMNPGSDSVCSLSANHDS